MRKLWGTAAALLVLGVLATTTLVLTGVLATVTTRGISMEPRVHTGDLIVVRTSSTYSVGDAAAYRSDTLDTVVFHRIVKVRNGHYTFQGDNNSWLDPEHPTQDELIGKELVHIPRGGIWLKRLTSPVALGVLAFGLLAAGGNAARTRRARRRRRTVSQHAARPTGRRTLAGLPSWLTTTAAGAAVVGVLGVALGIAAWTSSTTPVAAVEAGSAVRGQQMTFDYTTTVPESPAYDGTTVTAPQPVFRKLADTVDVIFTYTGAPGRIAVEAELSTTSGWSSTVPLRGSEKFTGPTYTGTVTLDLDGLEKRAQAAAAATGIPVSEVTVTVVPTVTTSDDKKFKPALALSLSPLQLKLAGDRSSLTVGDAHPPAATPGSSPTTPVLTLAGREMAVTTARTVSIVMGAGALLVLLLAGLLAWTTAPATESTAIRRRYAHLLVEVQPVATPPGRPVVDVVDFATLAKLAERYELLVLHWTRSDVDTFVVQDQGTTYRFRTGSGLGRMLTQGRPHGAPQKRLLGTTSHSR